MNMINKEPERHEIEALLPWHAAGTLSRRDADRVERALAGDRELARRYDIVREELAETIHLNETLGAPSARAMEKLFAAIDAEEARAPRRARSLDLGGRISEFLSGFAPRTLAWTAAAAVVAIVLQAAVITTVVLREHGAPGTVEFAEAPTQGSYAVVRFTPQATSSEITNFLGAHKATVVEGPMKSGSMYRIRLSETKLSADDVSKIIRQMQAESKIVGFVAVAPPQQ
jgi:anti-sigma-K factor RskA